MATTNVTTKIYLDKRHQDSKGTFAIKLRLTSNQKSRYYATGIRLTKSVFEKVMTGKKRSADEKELFMQLSLLEAKAIECISKIAYFSFEQFDTLFIKNRGATDSVEAAFYNYIALITNRESISYSRSYLTTINNLNKYKQGLRFIDITPSFLSSYDAYLRKKNKSLNTIGIYMRNLRVIINNAINDGIIESSFYPFGNRKYEIPTGVVKKRALHIKDIKSLFYYEPQCEGEQLAKDMWIFSYLCNGMNIVDILNLKITDIDGEYFQFTRQKTKRSANNTNLITVDIKKEVREIIDRYLMVNSGSNEYIFPFFSQKMDAKEKQNKKELITKRVNKYLNKIRERLGLENKITTYSARHSFATVLKQNGVNTEFISESLGHQSLKTTKIYLSNFEHENIKRVTNVLIPSNESIQ